MLRRPLPMRYGPAIALLTIAHATLSWGLFMFVFGMMLARFDTGGSASWPELVLEKVVFVLLSPAFHVLASAPTDRFPGLWGYLPLLFNSFIWAVVIRRR